MVHVGIGYDVHALVPGRKLVLGGVDIPHTKGLDGHSDADALLHAICDALLGALGEPDIGHFFPNTDSRWRGAPSRVFLEEAARLVASRHGRIVNLDSTLIAQAPRIYPHVQMMKENIASALGIEPRQVGIKATTNESLGFIGREEGIAAMAIVGIDLPEHSLETLPQAHAQSVNRLVTNRRRRLEAAGLCSACGPGLAFLRAAEAL